MNPAKKKFRLFLIVFLLLLVIVGTWNICINPYGYYGNTNIGDAPIFNSRVKKLEHLRERETVPQVVVMGSSNSMRMLPATIERITGKTAFNYGVFQARVEDFYCISRAMKTELGELPEMVVLCLDDWNLAQEPAKPDEVFEGAERRLAYHPELAQYLDDYNPMYLRWCQFKNALTWEQTKTSFKVVRLAWQNDDLYRRNSPMEAVFTSEGVRLKYADFGGADVTELAEAGEYNPDAILEAEHIELLRYSNKPKGFLSGTHEDFEKFSELRWQYFRDLVAFLDSNDVKLVVQIMPMQPTYQNWVEEGTNYNERLDVLKDSLTNFQAEFKSLVYVQDHHSIDLFNGKREHFFDHLHPTSVNSDLMLENLFKHVPEDAF